MKAYQILLVENEYEADAVEPEKGRWIEKIRCELGASDSTHPGKAQDPVFTTKLDGTHTLDFELPRYYLDPTTGENVLNELVELVGNKSKIICKIWKNAEDKRATDSEGQALKNYEEFHFFVNERTDVRKDTQITYSFSCMDSFIEELSKTGYGLTFTGELGQNGLGTIHELAEIVLGKEEDEEGNVNWTSGWKYEVKDKFYEYRTDLKYNIDQGRYDTVKVAKPVHKVKWIKSLERYCYLMDKKRTVEKIKGKDYLKNIARTLVKEWTIEEKIAIIKTMMEQHPGDNYVKSFKEDFRKKLNIAETESNITTAIFNRLTTTMKKTFFEDFLNGATLLCTEAVLSKIQNKMGLNDTAFLERKTAVCPQIYMYEDSEQITANTVKNIIYNADHDDGSFTDISGWTSCRVEESGGTIEAVPGHLVMPYQYKKDDKYMYSMKIEQSTDNKKSFLINDTAAATNETLVANTPYLLSFNFGQTTKGQIYSLAIFSQNPLTNPDLLKNIREKSDYYTNFYNAMGFGQGVDSKGWYKIIKPSINISTPYFVFEVETEGKGTALYLYSIKLIKATGQAGENGNPTAEDNYLKFLGHPSIYNTSTFKEGDDPGNQVLPLICTTTEAGAGLSAYTNHSFQYIYFEGDEEKENLRNISAEEIFGEYPIFDPEDSYEEDDIVIEAVENISDVSSPRELPKTIYRDKYGRHYQYYTLKVNKEGWDSGSDWGAAFLGDGDNDKRRTLKAEKSNRFNLIQELAELFKVWPEFNTKDKIVSFKEGHLNQNFSGFHYGVNLESLQRKQDSETLVTKIIVEDVSNDYAEEGFVTIRTARDNPWGENYFYNFKHYVDQGLLADVIIDDGEKKLQVDKDLESLYSEVKGYNSKIFNANEKLATLKVDYSNVSSELKSLQYAMSGINERKISLVADLNNKNISKPDKDKINVSLDQYDYSYNKYEEQYIVAEKRKETLKTDIQKLDSIVSENQKKKTKAINAFEQKYLPFIKEGTWTDSSYVDNNTYYYDAQKISQTSAVPHASWTISVLDGSVLNELEEFEMKVGDQSILVDNDFFGVENNPEKNHTFEVLISAISEHFETPSKNSIEVRNYLTSFDDLFQRVAAATQTVQTKEQIFDKAANFTDNHQIDQTILQNTLAKNAFILANASDNSYTLDSNGLSLQSIINPAKKSRILAEGLFFSNSTGLDGKPEWKTGITADGIDASLLTAGEIDTSLIKILSNGQPSFVWNELGISAYAPSSVAENYGKVAVIGDSYSVTGESLTVKEEDGTAVHVRGWVDELKDLLGKDKIISAYENGGLGSTGFSPWFYPDYAGTHPHTDRENNRSMRFIDQLEKILSKLDSNNEEYPEYLLICGGFNDKTWCLNDLNEEEILKTIEMTNPVLSEYAFSGVSPSFPIVEKPLKKIEDGVEKDCISSGHKKLTEDDRKWDKLGEYKNIEDFLSIRNEDSTHYLYPLLAIHDQDSTISNDNYLILNGTTYENANMKDNNQWLKERSYGQLILRMRHFNEVVEKKYSQKGQRKPKVILVSTGRYAKRDSSLGYVDYTNTINQVLLKNTYKIYQILAEKLNWEYHDISGIIRTPVGLETWKDISWTNGEDNYIKNTKGKTDWVHPSTQGNQKIAKLLSKILEEDFSSEANYETGNILFLGDSYSRNYDCLVREGSNYIYKDDTVLYRIKDEYSEKDFLKGWPEALAEKYDLSANQFIDLGIGSSAFVPVDKNTKWKLYKNQLRNFTSRIGLFSYSTPVAFEDDVNLNTLNIGDGRWNYYYDYRNPTYEKLKDLDLKNWLDNLNYVVIGGGYNERIYFSDLEYWGKGENDTIPDTNTFTVLETEVKITKREIAFLQRLKLQRKYEKEKQENSELTKADFLAKAIPMQCIFIVMGKREKAVYNTNTGLERIYPKLKEYWTATGAGSLISSTGFTEPEIGANDISISEAYSLCNFKVIDISNEEWKSNGSYAEDGIHPSATGISNIARILSEEKRIFGAKKEAPQSYNGDYFTRFDSFGLYTIKNPIDYSFNYSEAGGIFQPWFEGLSREECIRRIQEESLVSLTEKGFALNVPGSNGGIKLGYEKLNSNQNYGLYINNKKGEAVVKLTNDAENCSIAGWKISPTSLRSIIAEDNNNSLITYLCTTGAPGGTALALGRIGKNALPGTAPFVVTGEGKLKATGIDVEGTIEATDGSIGPLKIETEKLTTEGDDFTGAVILGENYAVEGEKNWTELLKEKLQNDHGNDKPIFAYSEKGIGFSIGSNKKTITEVIPSNSTVAWVNGNTYWKVVGKKWTKMTALECFNGFSNENFYIEEDGGDDYKALIPGKCMYDPVNKIIYYLQGSSLKEIDLNIEDKVTKSQLKGKVMTVLKTSSNTKEEENVYYENTVPCYYRRSYTSSEGAKYKSFGLNSYESDGKTIKDLSPFDKRKIYYYAPTGQFIVLQTDENGKESWKLLDEVNKSIIGDKEVVPIKITSRLPKEILPDNNIYDGIRGCPEETIFWYESINNVAGYWYKDPSDSKWKWTNNATGTLEKIGHRDVLYYAPAKTGYFKWNTTSKKWEYIKTSSTSYRYHVHCPYDTDMLCQTAGGYHKGSGDYVYNNKSDSPSNLLITKTPDTYLKAIGASTDNYYFSPSGLYFYYSNGYWHGTGGSNLDKLLACVSNFTSLLNNVEDWSKISHVIIGGAWNDRTNVPVGKALIEEGIKQFCSYVNEKAPSGKKIKIIINFLPNSTSTTAVNNFMKVKSTYSDTCENLSYPKLKIEYRDMSEDWFTEGNIFKDYLPSSAGAQKIAGLLYAKYSLLRKGKIYGLISVDDGTRISSGFSLVSTSSSSIAFWAGYRGVYNNPFDDRAATNATDPGGWAKRTPFYVTYDGKLYAKNADIKGTINATSGNIDNCTLTNCTIESAAISNASITSLSVSKLVGGDPCRSNVEFTNINASGGQIGSWMIKNGSLSSQRTLNLSSFGRPNMIQETYVSPAMMGLGGKNLIMRTGSEIAGEQFNAYATIKEMTLPAYITATTESSTGPTDLIVNSLFQPTQPVITLSFEKGGIGTHAAFFASHLGVFLWKQIVDSSGTRNTVIRLL